MITDAEILTTKRVSAQLAARYLGMTDDLLRLGMQHSKFPFGVAVKSPKSGKWIYDIRPEALVTYKHHGTGFDTGSITDIVKKIVTNMKEEL